MLDTGYLLDIIIVNYQSSDFLCNNLASVYSYISDIPVNILVHDNGSDEELKQIKDQFPDVRITTNAYNMGFAKAINNALKQSAAPYIVIINPDTIVNKEFFQLVLDYMKNNSDVGIVGPKIFNNDGTIQGSARSFPSFYSAFFGRSSIMTKLFPNCKLSRKNILTKINDGKTPMEVDWVSGACLVVRRKAFEDVGFLDESFFMYWEDVDWCKRMWLNGWKIVYFPVASIMHHIGGSSRNNILQSVFEFHKSAYYFFHKHMKPSFSFLKPLFFSTYFLGISSRFILVLFIKLTARFCNAIASPSIFLGRDSCK